MKDMIQYDMKKHEDDWQENPIDTKYYIAFVLGYDLLQDKFMEYHDNGNGNKYPCECDTCFYICLYLAEKFMDSFEYLTMDCSAYDALQEWIETHSKIIDEVTAE